MRRHKIKKEKDLIVHCELIGHNLGIASFSGKLKKQEKEHSSIKIENSILLYQYWIRTFHFRIFD